MDLSGSIQLIEHEGELFVNRTLAQQYRKCLAWSEHRLRDTLIAVFTAEVLRIKEEGK